jgi:methionyl-tRNA formyltransferase
VDRRDAPALSTKLETQGPSGLGIVFVGCVTEGFRSLEHLLRRGERVLCIFTLRDDLAAKTSGAMRFDEVAERHGIPLVKVRNINDPEPVERIRALAPDLVLVIGWTQLVKADILRIPRHGCIGFHASLLPQYRGRAPINWALINGESRTGNTMMLLEEGVDDGDILAQREIPIGFEDTCATLYEKVAETEFDMLDEVLPLIRAGRMPRRKQDPSRVSVMPKRRPEDGLIDWSKSARRLYDWVRALTHPYPGAFTHLGDLRVFVWQAALAEGAGAALRPSEITVVDGALIAGTGEGLLRLVSVQAEGEPEMSGVDFAARHVRGTRASFNDAPSGVSA